MTVREPESAVTSRFCTRRNTVVIADGVHRCQYDFIDTFARQMLVGRDLLRVPAG